MIAGYLLALVFTDFKGKSGTDIVMGSTFKFMWCFIIGIWVGLSNMFGHDIYFYLKKN